MHNDCIKFEKEKSTLNCCNDIIKEDATEDTAIQKRCDGKTRDSPTREYQEGRLPQITSPPGNHYSYTAQQPKAAALAAFHVTG
jgi:hypothetical protein